MNRQGLALLCSLLLASAGFAQSLGELAKKEKERRQKTKGPVRVIDAEALKHGRPESAPEDGTNGDGGQATAEPVGPGQSSASASPRSSPSASGAGSLAEMKDRRQKCADDLRTAEEEKKRQQALFDQGIAQVAVIDTTTGPKPQGTPVGTPYRQVGVDRNGVPIRVPAGNPEAKVNVEGSRVSCSQALGNSSKYPQEASKCAEMQKRISAADERIKKALDCVRSR